MADSMICPLCGMEHPLGTTWCPERLAWIPVSSTDENQQTDSLSSPVIENKSIASNTTAEISQCPNCGYPGQAGEVCIGCNEIVPNAIYTQADTRQNQTNGDTNYLSVPLQARAEAILQGVGAEQDHTAHIEVAQIKKVSLHLPNGQQVGLPRGREIVIGRQSEISEISESLAPLDSHVSRRHCYVTIDPVQSQVTIRDPGSTNHTWVGDDPQELASTEQRTVNLPIRIRLGQYIGVYIALVDCHD